MAFDKPASPINNPESSRSEEKQNMEIQSVDNDTIVEILSWLPAESLLLFETVSKGWHNIISDNSFRRLQCQRAKAVISGFFILDTFHSDEVKYLSCNTTGTIVHPKVWDFLADDKVTLSASSNGLLCCHTEQMFRLSKEVPKRFIYVCNPAMKEHVQIEWPKGSDRYVNFALAVDPLCNLIDDFLNFKLVCISKEEDSSFMFQVYSSRMKEWRELDKWSFDYDSPGLPGDQVVFTGGAVYWMTQSSGIIALDMETEQPYLLSFPVRWIHRNHGFHENCIGESEGQLHYILISEVGLQVWFLDSERKWMLKHSVQLSAVEEKYPHFLYNEGKKAAGLVPQGIGMIPWIDPLAYKDDILLLKLHCNFSYQKKVGGMCGMCTKMYLYNFGRTKSLEELCIWEGRGISIESFHAVPYSMTLAPLEST